MAKDVAGIMGRLSRYRGEDASVLHASAFKVLIATVLSQRTRDANTRRAAEGLFSRFGGPKELADAPLNDIAGLIRGTGFFRVKAERIKRISKIIVERYDGSVPSSRRGLMQLPGVGAKTSACVLVYAFKKPEICVDTHVHRVSNRLGLVDTGTAEETEAALRKVVPKKYWLNLNHLMVRFGQRVCLPRNPRHSECPLREQCDFANKRGKWQNS
jgi:endonuclease-3